MANKLLLVDPNDEGMGNVPHEDLSIFVDLEVYNREYDVIIHSKGEATNILRDNSKPDDLVRISFIDTNSEDESSNFLNTHYTEVNTSFNKDNKDLGTLGIEYIDISFNSSYVPVVKIRFKDVRGRLFEEGNDSPYAFMFKMPYPIFYLTVKGYYGKAVRYALHMTKFNGELDNDTGNFIINCEFIGYTYAFLTDILMGYIKDIPYTSYGQKIIKEDGEFIGLNDIKTVVELLQKSTLNYKEDNPNLKALNGILDLNIQLQSLKTSINETIILFKENYNGEILDVDGTNSKDIIFLREDPNFTTYQAEILDAILNFNETAKLLNSNYLLDNTNFILKGGNSYYERMETTDITFPKSIEDFNKEKNRGKYKNFILTDNDKTNTQRTILFNEFKQIIESVEFSNTLDGRLRINVIDLRLGLREINSLLETISSDLNDFKKSVNSEFIMKIEEDLRKSDINFDPTIGFLFKVLCNHADIFIESIRNVAETVQSKINSNQRVRLKDNKIHFQEYENKDDTIPIRPFPEYKDKDSKTGTYTDKWIGSDPKFMSLDEVKFIDELYETMIKRAQEDELLDIRLANIDKLWYPVNPLDSILWDDNNKNPWELIENSNHYLIYKLMIERMVTFLSYSNSSLINNEVIDMAKIEARQAFKNIKTDKTKLTVPTNNLTSILYKLNENYNLDLSKSNDKYIYKVNSENAKYIPISQSLNELKSKSDVKGKLFGGSNLSENKGEQLIKILKPYDYTTTGRSFYDYSANLSKNDKGDITKIVKTKNGVNIHEHNYILGGKFKTPEFSKIKDGSVYPLSLEFYGESHFISKTRKEGVNRNDDTFTFSNNQYILDSKASNKKKWEKVSRTSKKLKDEMKAHLDKESNSYSFIYTPKFYSNGISFDLFGSEFYYRQRTDEAKAFLFLHTLPFRGLDSFEGYHRDLFKSPIVNYFNKRAGFVNVPYSWVLFIGALLYRNNENNEIITFIDNNEILIPGGVDSTFDFKKDEYLMTFGKLGSDNEYRSHGRAMNFYGVTRVNNSKYFLERNKISDIILNLPKSVKTEFINEFKNWVNREDSTGFQNLKSKLEIFKSDSTPEDRKSAWDDLSNAYVSDTLSENVEEHYTKIKPLTFNDGIWKNAFEFELEMRSGNYISEKTVTTRVMKDLNDFLFEERIIMNNTYRTWLGNKDNINFEMSIEQVENYVSTFLEEFKSLNEGNNVTIDDSDTRQKLFKTNTVDDIKLSIYKNIKSVYDKWIVGVKENTPSIITRDLFSSFRFIDRAHNDISNDLKINPITISDLLTSNENTSLYAFMAKILNANNFDFIPLPTYVDYTNKTEVKEIFQPIPFNEMETASGPQFICMYIGEHSSRLDLDNKNNKGDGFDRNDIPSDFSKPIPYFMVSYADQNQSIFKNITVNQSEFTETNEGLQIIENLSKQNRNNAVGQNLFDIYKTRSYSAEIEMLGCAQIQPFMYFELGNIPMFNGAYTIINTSHNITPNHITTKFKGVRIRKTKTKLVDEETIYYNLITNLEGSSSIGADINKARKRINDYAKDIEIAKDANNVNLNDIKILDFQNPLSAMTVTSDFGPREGLNYHYGIDFRARIPTPIYAVANAEIITIKHNGDTKGGLYIDMKISNKNTEKDYYVTYMHLSEISNRLLNYVDEDFNFSGSISVTKGEELGKTGDTGAAGSPHLHMIIRTDSNIDNKASRKNPQWFFKDSTNWKWEQGQILLKNDIEKFK